MSGVSNCKSCGQFVGKKRGGHRCKGVSPRGGKSLRYVEDPLFPAVPDAEDPGVGVERYSGMYDVASKLVKDREEGQVGEQLPMLLTPREIVEGWSPTEGDRLYWYEDGRGSPSHDETDEEFWARKLREAQGVAPRRNMLPSWGSDVIPPAPSREYPGFVDPDPPSYPTAEYSSLYEDLEANGMADPVSLEPKGRAVEEGKDKPQVLGGNHRIVAMNGINPDEPVPVVFFESVKQARESLGEDTY